MRLAGQPGQYCLLAPFMAGEQFLRETGRGGGGAGRGKEGHTDDRATLYHEMELYTYL